MNEYDVLAEKLEEALGASAPAMLAALDELYPDPPQRLAQLKMALRQQQVELPDVVQLAAPAVPSVPQPDAATPRRGGFAKVYTAVIDALAPKMPDPVFRAYVYACRLADDTDSTFWISHKTLGEKIGRRSRESGKRALKLLAKAGVIRRTARGGPGHATTYQLVPVRELDFKRAEQVFGSWLEVERVASKDRAKRRAERKSIGSATDPGSGTDPI